MQKNVKDTIFFIIISLLTVSALVYGFNIVPSPGEQRSANFDDTRASNLAFLQMPIEAYYQDNKKLPNSLADLSYNVSQYSAKNEDIKLDPETKREYEYKKTSETTYQLCATFGSDTLAATPQPTSTKSVDFSKHSKGNYCFDIHLPEYMTKLSPSPFPISPSTPTIQCLGACSDVTPTVRQASSAAILQ